MDVALQSARHTEAGRPPLARTLTAHADALPFLEYFQELRRSLGSQEWWPAHTRFEVIVGAILTQNTSWTNVERAIAKLRINKLLSPDAMFRVSSTRLATLIHSSGYYRQKTRKLKAFVRFLRGKFGGSLTLMFRTPTSTLREMLLSVHGIGPETADSILLYAGGHPVFVVDSYTKRILLRHGWADERTHYEEIQNLIEQHLPRQADLFNEFHALIVMTGKKWCHAQEPNCNQCPLGGFYQEGR